MSPKYKLTESPPPEAYQKMWAPLLEFNQATVGNATARTLAVLLNDAKTDEIIGGLWAWSLWGSLYIAIVFVPEPLRGTGIGTSPLRQAEQEAMRRGCREMWLDTYAFQARSYGLWSSPRGYLVRCSPDSGLTPRRTDALGQE
jgi:GNAT superfamily N-acetyltransferase